MSVSIRLATAVDVEEVVRVIRAVYEEYRFTWDPTGYHADLYDLQRHYFDRGHAFWVAQQEEGALIGTGALKFFDTLPGAPGTSRVIDDAVRLGGCDCALARLYVHPLARRQGIGSMLVRTVLEEARRRGRRHLEIWSDKRFLNAHRLYGKFGAVPVSERICYDPDESPECGLLIRL